MASNKEGDSSGLGPAKLSSSFTVLAMIFRQIFTTEVHTAGNLVRTKAKFLLYFLNEDGGM